MKKQILKQFILHYTVSMSVILLSIAFLTLLFFYYTVYRPLLGTAEIYELKGQVNIVTIKTDALEEAYDALKQKTSPAGGGSALVGLRSPF